MTNTSCCEYDIKTPDDGQEVCPKYIELYIKIKLRNGASCWLLLYEWICVFRQMTSVFTRIGYLQRT
jgi:hypothetical protein